jgi:hypothetical protein
VELVGLAEQAEVQITVNAGSIIISPVDPVRVDPERFEAALERVVKTRRDVLRRLAE